MSPATAKRPASQSTSEKLLEAAAVEFNELGFGGTDTNKIARRAGFAPQTFYRWFQDKEEIFIQVYDRWRQEQFAEIGVLLAENADDDRVARAVVAHHKNFLIFRRSLRHLALEFDVIRTARARSRLEQVSFLKAINSAPAHGDADLAVILLQTERLADALAEGELRDMGLDEEAALTALTGLSIASGTAEQDHKLEKERIECPRLS